MKKGWQKHKLGDLLEIQNGYAFDAKEFTPSGGMPLIRIRDLKGGAETKTRFTGGYDKKYVVKAGDLLIGMDGEFGCYEWKGKPALLNQRVCRLRGFAKQLLPQFLFYGVNSHLKEIEDVTGYATVKHISSKQVLGINFSIPPLPEQQRIVNILGEAFECIANAKANDEKNLLNARALFESHLQSIFNQRGKGWVDTSLGDTYDVRDGTHDSPKYHASGYPLITSKNLKREGLSFDDVKLISEQDYEKINERSAVHKGDVLFAMIGTIGNPTVVTVEPNFAIKNVALFKIPRGQSGVFLKHYLESGLVISKMMKEAKGTTQKFVGLGYLRAFPIYVPPFATQLEVVKRLKELSEETHRLESIYRKKLAALEALKKSLLNQAFTGNL